MGETETAVLDIYYVYDKVVLNNPTTNKWYCGSGQILDSRILCVDLICSIVLENSKNKMEIIRKFNREKEKETN